MSSRIVSVAGGRNFWISREPERIEPLRFAVRDARRHVAIGDQHEPASEPALQIQLPLVAVRHVQQLHHVGLVVALALKRARDLLADRRAVVGKRHEAGLAAALLQPVAQPLGLRLLAALVESFKDDEHIQRAISTAAYCGPGVERRGFHRLEVEPSEFQVLAESPSLGPL